MARDDLASGHDHDLVDVTLDRHHLESEGSRNGAYPGCGCSSLVMIIAGILLVLAGICAAATCERFLQAAGVKSLGRAGAARSAARFFLWRSWRCERSVPRSSPRAP